MAKLLLFIFPSAPSPVGESPPSESMRSCFSHSSWILMSPKVPYARQPSSFIDNLLPNRSNPLYSYADDANLHCFFFLCPLRSANTDINRDPHVVSVSLDSDPLWFPITMLTSMVQKYPSSSFLQNTTYLQFSPCPGFFAAQPDFQSSFSICRQTFVYSCPYSVVQIPNPLPTEIFQSHGTGFVYFPFRNWYRLAEGFPADQSPCLSI